MNCKAKCWKARGLEDLHMRNQHLSPSNSSPWSQSHCRNSQPQATSELPLSRAFSFWASPSTRCAGLQTTPLVCPQKGLWSASGYSCKLHPPNWESALMKKKSKQLNANTEKQRALEKCVSPPRLHPGTFLLRPSSQTRLLYSRAPSDP